MVSLWRAPLRATFLSRDRQGALTTGDFWFEDPTKEENYADIHREGSWTDQGIRGLKDVPKRIQAARDLAKKLGIDFKQIYLTSGDTDLLVILETASPDNIPKFNLAIGAMGNIRTSTVRAWTEAETIKLISELP